MITQTKFYKEYKEEIVTGLAAGLAWGLATGLVAGLATGLVTGLAWGLATGLVVILVNFPEAFPFISGIQEIALVILGILFIIELFFWLDRAKKPKGISTLKFTLKNKFESFLEVMLGLSAIAQIYILIREARPYYPEILKWIGYIGAGAIVLIVIALIIYLWIKLNEQKYKK